MPCMVWLSSATRYAAPQSAFRDSVHAKWYYVHCVWTVWILQLITVSDVIIGLLLRFSELLADIVRSVKISYLLTYLPRSEVRIRLLSALFSYLHRSIYKYRSDHPTYLQFNRLFNFLTLMRLWFVCEIWRYVNAKRFLTLKCIGL